MRRVFSKGIHHSIAISKATLRYSKRVGSKLAESASRATFDPSNNPADVLVLVCTFAAITAAMIVFVRSVPGWFA